jgi:hypothetical protein
MTNSIKYFLKTIVDIKNIVSLQKFFQRALTDFGFFVKIEM